MINKILMFIILNCIYLQSYSQSVSVEDLIRIKGMSNNDISIYLDGWEYSTYMEQGVKMYLWNKKNYFGDTIEGVVKSKMPNFWLITYQTTYREKWSNLKAYVEENYHYKGTNAGYSAYQNSSEYMLGVGVQKLPTGKTGYVISIFYN
jgi:hypothetical protein